MCMRQCADLLIAHVQLSVVNLRRPVDRLVSSFYFLLKGWVADPIPTGARDAMATPIAALLWTRV